jgi:hypothetical protein
MRGTGMEDEGEIVRFPYLDRRDILVFERDKFCLMSILLEVI